MTAKRFRSAIVCAVIGHRWDWQKHVGTIDDAPYRCKRCGVYEDKPGVKRAAARRAWLRIWSPIWPTINKHGAGVRIGWAYKPFTACVSLRIHWHAERQGELPGVTAAFEVWRLRLAAGIGGGWQDEDGEDRGFLYLTGRFKTYGWRWIGCWLGHKPEPSQWNPSTIYCARCDEVLTAELTHDDAEIAA